MGGRGASSSSVMRSASVGGIKWADSSTQAFHQQRLVMLMEHDEYPPGGTYNLQTLEPVDYPSGYSVTFYQVGDNYTPEEYANLVNEFYEHSSDGIASAGKFDGLPEVSFNVADRNTAVILARRFNQDSIFDWATGTLIKTGGTGWR